MDQMHAAVVSAFDRPPRYELVDPPDPAPGEIVVDVVAVGLHPRVRSGAAGRHYSSTGVLPMIPGIDGVGRRADGRLIYFVADDHHRGTMTERAVVDPRRAVELPDSVDVARVAAAMNPAMSSWIALRRRIDMPDEAGVLVLGATGNAGGMAVVIARLLGAHFVIGAGRDARRLATLRGADTLVTIGAPDEAHAVAETAAKVDVVLDYLWGEPSERIMMELLTARPDRSRAVRWVQIGSIAGATLALPSAALRSANLQLLGSGQGSVSPRDYVAELPSLVAAISAGEIPVTIRCEPLSDIERVWAEPETPGVRTVLVR